MKDMKTKESFLKYLEQNPELRFWQALRNWSEYDFIYGSNELVDQPDLIDTFYKEETE